MRCPVDFSILQDYKIITPEDTMLLIFLALLFRKGKLKTRATSLKALFLILLFILLYLFEAVSCSSIQLPENINATSLAVLLNSLILEMLLNHILYILFIGTFHFIGTVNVCIMLHWRNILMGIEVTWIDMVIILKNPYSLGYLRNICAIFPIPLADSHAAWIRNNFGTTKAWEATQGKGYSPHN